ncbi:MAG: DNA adenine methylase [Maritalea sp.]|jgi:DNA adenine methylase
MRGRAILSLNDTPGVRETFDGLNMETFDLQYTIGQASAGPKEVTEVLIYNFDLPDEGLLGLL